MPETWRRTGPDRLAPDAAVARPGQMLGDLAAGAGPAIAWTTVTSPALVLGRAAQDPPLDLDLAGREGIAILRRGSGGGAVLWDTGLLALDVALPSEHRLADRDVVRAYRWLGEALGAAMAEIGVPGVRVVRTRSWRGPTGSPPRPRPRPASAPSRPTRSWPTGASWSASRRSGVGTGRCSRRGSRSRSTRAACRIFFGSTPSPPASLSERTVGLRRLVPSADEALVIATVDRHVAGAADAHLAP